MKQVKMLLFALGIFCLTNTFAQTPAKKLRFMYINFTYDTDYTYNSRDDAHYIIVSEPIATMKDWEGMTNKKREALLDDFLNKAEQLGLKCEIRSYPKYKYNGNVFFKNWLSPEYLEKFGRRSEQLSQKYKYGIYGRLEFGTDEVNGEAYKKISRDLNDKVSKTAVSYSGYKPFKLIYLKEPEQPKVEENANIAKNTKVPEKQQVDTKNANSASGNIEITDKAKTTPAKPQLQTSTASSKSMAQTNPETEPAGKVTYMYRVQIIKKGNSNTATVGGWCYSNALTVDGPAGWGKPGVALDAAPKQRMNARIKEFENASRTKAAQYGYELSGAVLIVSNFDTKSGNVEKAIKTAKEYATNEKAWGKQIEISM